MTSEKGRSMLNDMYVLDADGHPRQADDLTAWVQWMESNKRIVRQDTIGDVFISTVFLGLDHGIGLSEHPILWETMVFIEPWFKGNISDGMWRFSSRERALAKHQELAEKYHAKT